MQNKNGRLHQVPSCYFHVSVFVFRTALRAAFNASCIVASVPSSASVVQTPTTSNTADLQRRLLIPIYGLTVTCVDPIEPVHVGDTMPNIVSSSSTGETSMIQDPIISAKSEQRVSSTCTSIFRMNFYVYSAYSAGCVS